MKIKILKAEKSVRSIWDTKLGIKGVIGENDDVPFTEQAYELVVHIYDFEHAETPLRTVKIKDEYYTHNVQKYGMEALLKGVELNSMLSIAESSPGSQEVFKREVEAISYSIIARLEKDTLFNTYNPHKLREYIEEKMLNLQVKFKIEPK